MSRRTRQPYAPTDRMLRFGEYQVAERKEDALHRDRNETKDEDRILAPDIADLFVRDFK